MTSPALQSAYDLARERYAALGLDTPAAIDQALSTPLSMHCWQADDVGGFEVRPGAVSGGGIMATGNYPGRARTPDEARADYDQVLGLVPGTLRLNVHACYAVTGGQAVDRDQLAPEHFQYWMDWSREQGVHLDFNPTYFAHPKANQGYTLSSTDPGIRRFWVQHGIASRVIAEAIAKSQDGPCINNHWIPDGDKDLKADRWVHRARLVESLDEIIVDEPTVDKTACQDYVESKLFGLGSEEYVVGSSEFYSSYALSRDIGLCMDMGHYHPTETIHDKISAFLTFHRKLLLHVSRPLRWDSDHVVIFNDDLRNVFLEIARGKAWDRVALATDFFDASINRIAAYTVGLRATRKAILYALLDPSDRLQQLEAEGRMGARLAMMDDMKTMPFGAVWDYACEQAGVPVDGAWIDIVEAYEREVLSTRS